MAIAAAHRIPLFLTVILSVLALASCSVGPDYVRPNVPAPSVWSDPQDNGAAASPSADWWRGFSSPRLDQLIAQARQTNDDIAAAVARVQEADAQARIAGAPLLPAIGAGATATNERQPTSSGKMANRLATGVKSMPPILP